MTFLLHFTPFMMKLTVQHMGDTLLTLTNLDYLTITIKLKDTGTMQMLP